MRYLAAAALILGLVLPARAQVGGLGGLGGLRNAGYGPNGNTTFKVFNMGDTQNFSTSPVARLPDLQDTATRICAEAAAQEIIAVAHMGDIVQDAEVGSQLDNMETVFDILDGCNMPYTLTMGNHDVYDTVNGQDSDSTVCAAATQPGLRWDDGTDDTWAERWLPRLESKWWYKGRGPDITNDIGIQRSYVHWIATQHPSWHIISIGWCIGQSVAPPAWDKEQLEWVISVVEANPNTNFLINGHFHGATQYPATSANASPTYETLIDNYDNVYASHHGHTHPFVDFENEDVAGCTGCFARDHTDLQTTSTGASFYNWNSYMEIDVARKRLCRRSWRLTPLPIIYDESGIPADPETCTTYLRPFIDGIN